VIADSRTGQSASHHETIKRQCECDEAARDRRCTGSTVCLKDITIDYDARFTESREVDHRTQAAPNQALNFVSAA
jgi:hypothetical protein